MLLKDRGKTVCDLVSGWWRDSLIRIKSGFDRIGLLPRRRHLTAGDLEEPLWHLTYQLAARTVEPASTDLGAIGDRQPAARCDEQLGGGFVVDKPAADSPEPHGAVPQPEWPPMKPEPGARRASLAGCGFAHRLRKASDVAIESVVKLPDGSRPCSSVFLVSALHALVRGSDALTVTGNHGSVVVVIKAHDAQSVCGTMCPSSRRLAGSNYRVPARAYASPQRRSSHPKPDGGLLTITR